MLVKTTTALSQGVAFTSDERVGYFDYYVTWPLGIGVDTTVLTLELAADGYFLLDEHDDDIEITEEMLVKIHCAPIEGRDW